MASDEHSRWQHDPQYLKGLHFLAQGAFFEAHEALEDVWRPLTGPDRQLLQGLIQIAVALHHNRHSNPEGARLVLARASQNLKPFPALFRHLDLGKIRDMVQNWLNELSINPP